MTLQATSDVRSLMVWIGYSVALVEILAAVLFAVLAWEWFIWPADLIYASIFGSLIPRPQSLTHLVKMVAHAPLTWVLAWMVSFLTWTSVPLFVLGGMFHILPVLQRFILKFRQSQGVRRI